MSRWQAHAASNYDIHISHADRSESYFVSHMFPWIIIIQ